MKSVVQLALCLGVSALVSACGQSFAPLPLPESPLKPLANAQVQSLAGKSVEDVLKLKYNSIELQCELHLKRGPARESASTNANDLAVVDLKNGLPETREIKLQVQSEGRVANVTLTLKSLEMNASMKHTDLNTGTVHKMEYSPFVTADLAYEEKLPESDGFIVTSVRQGLTLNEGIEFRPIDQAVASNPKPVQDFTTFACTLVAEIKPEYKDQFKVEHIQ